MDEEYKQVGDAGRRIPGDTDAYNDYIESIRDTEYPSLKDGIYLDHAGTTLHSKVLMERFHADMMANLYGNPHSASPSSQRSTQMIENVRLQLLSFCKADPDEFDLVFTANATAAIKLVVEAVREQEGGFDYAYHVDSHTSLIGVREAAISQICLESDDHVETWVDGLRDRPDGKQLQLFAYPAQSNMNGRRLPLDWCRLVKQTSPSSAIYIMLDAAAYASTTQLDLSELEYAPEFTVLSLNKIFGFPDLGALIVRKNVAHLFKRRQYFGGGTVDMVSCLKEQWHAPKSGSLHEQLEDGTLPTHSILALRSAVQTHEQLFGTLRRISEHTTNLAKRLYTSLQSLKHGNGTQVCQIYKHARSEYGDDTTQGPIVALNLRDSKGNWISTTEVEKLASIKNIHLRTGGVCNPGGIATALNLSPWELRENFSAGHRCGSENDIMNGKPTGVIRLSLGVMSTRGDVDRFIEFLDEFFVEKIAESSAPPSPLDLRAQRFYIESLTVYPIKSCGGWQVPCGQDWEVRAEGLAWDREWCVVHQGTNKALSQKQYPRMALLRPRLNFKTGILRIGFVGASEEVSVPLSRNPALYVRESDATVCGDPVKTLKYSSSAIAIFFTKMLGVACTLARHNPASTISRHSKDLVSLNPARAPQCILLSNESPILTISRSSLNRLNEQIKAKGGKAAHPSVFRANIVLAESPLLAPGQEQPWAEDVWSGMRIGDVQMEFLGGCRRCQMVCVDQESAEKSAEPFLTLAKTRRYNGKVLFGVHTALADVGGRYCSVRVGNVVETFARESAEEV